MRSDAKPTTYMTPDVEARATALYAEGRNDEEIADALFGDCTKAFRVRSWRIRMGLVSHRRTPLFENHELTMKELAARAEGLSYGQFQARRYDAARGFMTWCAAVMT